MDTQPLLTPLTISGLSLPNRVVMASMTRARADNPERVPTPLHARYYSQRAGAGLIITGGTWVNEDAVGAVRVPGIFTEAQTAGWATVTEAVHEAGGRIFCQLVHSGAMSHPDHLGGRRPVAPSAVNLGEQTFTPSGMKDTVDPRELATAEISQIIADHRSAARNAHRAGFDGVEIHAQGQYLIPEFLNPRLNQRTDAYGGTRSGRARLLLEIVNAVQGIWNQPRVGVKISPFWSGGAFADTDETRADYDWLVRELDTSALAYLHLMGPAVPAPFPDEHLALFARYRAQFRGTLVANYGFSRDLGNTVVEQGLADAVSFATPFVANPDLVERFAAGHALAEPDRTTFYTLGAAGYTDYATANPTENLR